MKRLLVLAMAAIFLIVGLVGSAQARVGLTATTTTVPAERTTQIGAAYNGVIPPAGPVNWVAGADYAALNILSMYHESGSELLFTNGATWDWFKGASTYPRTSGANTLSLQSPTAIANGTTVTIQAQGAALDLSSITTDNVTTYSVQGRTVGVGSTIIDSPSATSVILRTVKQYNAGATTTASTTIDAIGNQAYKFLDAATSAGTILSPAATLTIANTNAFGATTVYSPAFTTGDQLVVTLSGDDAFQGMRAVRFGGAGGYTRNVTASSLDNSRAFTFTPAQMRVLSAGTDPGLSGNNITLLVDMISLGTVEMRNRTINANATLTLGGSGNGDTDYNLGTPFEFTQNGTRFRLSRFSTAVPQVTNTKLTNTSNVPVNVDVIFYEEGGVPTAWTRYDAVIPANDSLSISKEDIMRVLNITDTTLWGFVEFRAHTALQNITAQAFMRNSTNNFAANVPIPYFDVNKWSF